MKYIYGKKGLKWKICYVLEIKQLWPRWKKEYFWYERFSEHTIFKTSLRERDLRIKKLSLGSLLLRGKHLTGQARHTGQKIDSGPAFGRWAFEAQGSQTMCWQLRRWSRMDWSADEGPLKQARQRSQEDILGDVLGPVQPYFLASFPSSLGHLDQRAPWHRWHRTLWR